MSNKHMERLKSSTGIESLLGDTLENAWRLDRVAHQTILWYDTNHKRPVKRRKHKKFRNPVIQAREIALAMELEGLSRADLARRFGCSRARVTQKLNLLNLPRDLLMEIEALGDRRLVTERGLRRSLRGAPSARYS